MAIPGSRPNNRLVLIIGIVCAVIAFGGVLYLLRSSGSGPTTRVLVFTKDFPANTVLTTDSVTTADLPQALVPRDAVLDPAGVVGKQTAGNVTANTTVVPSLLQAPGGGGAPGSTSSGGKLSITPGYVALSIPSAVTFAPPPATNPYTIIGGAGDLMSVDYYIAEGDHIDILIAIPAGPGPEIRYSFQDVRILKVGVLGSTAAATPASYVIELPRGQAEVMTNLMNVTCNAADTNPGCKAGAAIKYVLRPRCEYGDPNYAQDSKAITGKTPDEFSALTGQTKADLQKKLDDACIHPYPNYEQINNGGFPLVPTLPGEGGATPQTLQQLFQIP